MVQFSGGTTGGTTVTVDQVTLDEGGFVTIHDSSLGDGDVLGSVRGTSEYLEQGTHENVTVTLDEPLSGDDTLFAMAHRDTNGDRAYEFVSSNGEVDGPYTTDGDIVMASANVTVSASVSATDIPTNGGAIVVDRVELSEGGFVTIHDASVTEGAVFDSIRGTSAYLEAGVHENVRINLQSAVTRNATLVPMAHMDTNGNQEYDFATSEGSADGPYANADGSAVVDTMSVVQTDTAAATFANQTTGGERVVVEDVFVPKGGFVTVHDASLLDGAVFDSVAGTSAKLSPGYHAEVEVLLNESIENDSTLVAMPHEDSNRNDQYDFVTSDGADDGPYTDDGSAVVDAGTVSVSATVSMADQSSDGRTVVVEDVDLSEGGFVTIHDSSLFAGETFGSAIGTSEYLEAGHHEAVTVTLDESVRSTATLVPMAHRDTNENEQYDFLTSEGSDDGPYVANGSAVVDTARVSVQAVLETSDQETNGSTVTIDSVTLHEGGFVTIHDASVTEGAVFESVRGTSEYLGPGTHENVTVELDSALSENATIVPMVHRDTNENEQYDFLTSEGAEDGPYVAAGGAVVTTSQVTVTPEATVSFGAQESDGQTVVVDSVTLNKGGFVTIHDASLQDGAVFESVRGTSTYLEAGTHEDVEVTLDSPVEEDTTLVAMPHQDTNANQAYDFVSSEGANDGPYVADGGAVVAAGQVTFSVEMETGMDEGTSTNDEATTSAETTDETAMDDGADGDAGGSPGFGVVVAVLALLGAAFLARRR
ncbi:PGF-CTERM sorting domain-containing protein [Halorubellus sp. JP-L1]|nr:PGF-CTERM sorting domain-containing protein [Halorubellus sp. JP-L1]